MFHKTLGPSGPSRFVFSALLIDDMNVFLDGCHPPVLIRAGFPAIWRLFFVMGALPAPESSISERPPLVKGGGLCYTWVKTQTNTPKGAQP